MTKDEVFTSLVQKFTSENSVLVTQAVITREEFNALFVALRDAKKDEGRFARVEALVDALDAIAKDHALNATDRNWAEWVRDQHHGKSVAYLDCAKQIRSALKGE